MTSLQDHDTVTKLTAKSLDPKKAIEQVFTEEPVVGLKAAKAAVDNLHEADLDKIATMGAFPYRPSDLFLKMFGAALDAVDRNPRSTVVSPALLGSSGVCSLSIISVIPDIMQHYHDVIVSAQKEVLIATNAWEPGRSVELVTDAFKILNDRAVKDNRTVVVKILMDAANIRNVLQPRYERKPSTWSKIGIPHEELSNLKLEVVNYHVAPLGTFHSKFAVIDREIGLVNSNNINIRSNVEMMCQFEGDIVNSLYDAFLISWGKPFPNPPGLPCVSTPAAAHRDFHFGDRHAHAPQTKQADGQGIEATDPQHELQADSAKYDKQNVLDTAVPLNERLNVMKPAKETTKGHTSDFVPFYLHTPHDPVPMALVNRPPQNLPGHHDIHNPQNAAWLAALKLAKEVVFIQSPVFNAWPVVEGVQEACKRGVTVILYVGLGFNDFAEGIVPFQGGTNDTVMHRMMDELSKHGKQGNLHWHWYTAKDQLAPLRFEDQARNCHVKFLQVDGQVAIMGSGNMDTQSWFHSQEVNVMVDSPHLVKEWMENFALNQNTGEYGRVDEHGNLLSGRPVPKKEGIGGLSRSQGGFL